MLRPHSLRTLTEGGGVLRSIDRRFGTRTASITRSLGGSTHVDIVGVASHHIAYGPPRAVGQTVMPCFNDPLLMARRSGAVCPKCINLCGKQAARSAPSKRDRACGLERITSMVCGTEEKRYYNLNGMQTLYSAGVLLNKGGILKKNSERYCDRGAIGCKGGLDE
jgi:hypothetical protein